MWPCTICKSGRHTALWCPRATVPRTQRPTYAPPIPEVRRIVDLGAIVEAQLEGLTAHLTDFESGVIER